MRPAKPILCTTIAMLLAGCAAFRGERPVQPSDSKTQSTAEKAAEIATQPVRDVGVAKPEIPPALLRAVHNPYDLTGLNNCRQLAAAITELSEALGPDYLLTGEKKENRAGKIAEAGGETIVNAIIPFRGLVREMSGAAAAKRRYDDAVDAGYARRGFLRGVHSTRRCPPIP